MVMAKRDGSEAGETRNGEMEEDSDGLNGWISNNGGMACGRR